MAAYDDRDYAREIKTSIDHSYDSLTEAILRDFSTGSTLSDVLSKYTPPENVSSLILKEFPLLGKEDDKELLDLYQAHTKDMHLLQAESISKVKQLLHECGVGMDEIDDFIVNKDGMGFFQEFSITNRTSVADKSFNVDYARIIERLESTDRRIDINIDVSNRDFEDEIAALEAKGIIRPDGTVDTTRDLIQDTMPTMQSFFELIKKDLSEGIGSIRHPMNDFQPSFVQRYEEYLDKYTNGIFKNLPELFLSFLDKSPVMKHFGVRSKNLKIGTITKNGRAYKSIIGSIKNVNIAIIGVQSDEIGIDTLLKNGLFFKLRTCESIVASQIRGMHRYVPMVIDADTEPLALIPKVKGEAAEDDPRSSTKSNKPAKAESPVPSVSSFGRSRKPSAKKLDGGAKNIDARPFFDLYQGQLLQSYVSNQEPGTFAGKFFSPVKVAPNERVDKKLEMEHIIGVYQAALMFKPECYPMTIFANLQIMSHNSNNGVASKPSMRQKLEFMKEHRDVSDEMSGRTFHARLRYLLARLYAMEHCLTDEATMRSRYEPYSSYKPGLEKIIYFLTHGVAFDVIASSRLTKFEEMQHKSKQMLRTLQSISRDLIEMHVHGNTPRSNELFKRMVDKLLEVKDPSIDSALVTIVPSGNPLEDYQSFVSRTTLVINKLYDGHCQQLIHSMQFLAKTVGIDIHEAIQMPLETLLTNPKIPPGIADFIKGSMVISLTAMKALQSPIQIYRGVLSTLFESTALPELDRLGKPFFDSLFETIMNDEDDEDQYSEAEKHEVPETPASSLEPAKGPVGPEFTMETLGASTVVDDSVLQYVKTIATSLGREGLTPLIKTNLLTGVIYKATVPFSNIEELLTFYEDDPASQQEISDIQDRLIREQDDVNTPAEAAAAAATRAPVAAAAADEGTGEGWEAWASGGGKYSSTEECYIYSEKEELFNRTGDQDAYDYLCNSWKLVLIEKEKKTQPFMSTSMQVLIAKKIVTLMRDKQNDALNDIYLTHYDRHDEPEVKSLLRMIYDYFTLQAIFVPMTRDERPLHSLQELLVECMRKKMKFMSSGGDEMSFDNAYANIVCIQIFGKHISIMIDDLSNGKLPIPYGIQNHLCHDPFYPETFTVTFNVLKCLTLALPKCVSLVTYLSYLNLLVGESFLDNLYTDSSFSVVERIHDSFFDKMKRMEINDRSGPAHVDSNKLPNLFIQSSLPAVPLPDIPLEPAAPPLPDYTDPLPSPGDLSPHLDSVSSTEVSGMSPLKPGAASGGTRKRRYKQTKRNQTLSKRFKKNRTRRLHGLYVRN